MVKKASAVATSQLSFEVSREAAQRERHILDREYLIQDPSSWEHSVSWEGSRFSYHPGIWGSL